MDRTQIHPPKSLNKLRLKKKTKNNFLTPPDGAEAPPSSSLAYVTSAMGEADPCRCPLPVLRLGRAEAAVPF